MRVDGLGVSSRLNGDLLQIGAVRKTRKRHLCRVIAVRAAIFRGNADSGQGRLHPFHVGAAHCGVIDPELGSGKHGRKKKQESREVGHYFLRLIPYHKK
jgi:hypothetical protein